MHFIQKWLIQEKSYTAFNLNNLVTVQLGGCPVAHLTTDLEKN